MFGVFKKVIASLLIAIMLMSDGYTVLSGLTQKSAERVNAQAFENTDNQTNQNSSYESQFLEFYKIRRDKEG